MMGVSSGVFYQGICSAPIERGTHGWRVAGLSIGYYWEKPLMITHARSIFCENMEVLEIGYGMGIFADAVSKFSPKRHVILEPHPLLFMKALAWAEDKPNVEVYQMLWQDFNFASFRFTSIMYDGFSEQGCKHDDFRVLMQRACSSLTSNGKFSFFCANPNVDSKVLALGKEIFSDVLINSCHNLEPTEDIRVRGVKDSMLVPTFGRPKRFSMLVKQVNSGKDYLLELASRAG